MIHGDMKTHNYEVNGIKPQIMTEVTTLLHQLYAECGFTKEDFEEMVKLACMSDEEVRDKAKETLSEQSVSKMIEKIFEDAENGKQEAIDALHILTDMMLKDMENRE